MKVKVLKCPECGANIEFEEDRNFCFCSYCGCKIVIDDENKKNVTKNINITKNINKTNRYINETDVIRAKSEIDKDRQNFKQFLILWGILLLMPIGIFLGLFLNKTIAQHEGKISAGYYVDLVGENYEFVKAHFEAAGFTNVELIDLDDAGVTFWKDGKVATISVGGNTSFESTDWFYPDTKIIISYH